jgi:hypothetical protein
LTTTAEGKSDPEHGDFGNSHGFNE